MVNSLTIFTAIFYYYCYNDNYYGTTTIRETVNWVVTHLYGLQKVGTLVQLTGVPSRPVRQPVSAGCTRWPWGRRLWLVTKAHWRRAHACDYALYKMTTFTFYLYYDLMALLQQ